MQKQMARELTAARRIALQSRPVVSRRFFVIWERHHGYFLAPETSPEKWVTPDFPNGTLRSRFDSHFAQDVQASHIGSRLICVCRGVEWTFMLGKRFSILDARLEWVRVN